MSRFTPVDYSLVPFPDAIQGWTFEAILAARMNDFIANLSRAKNPDLPPYDVGTLETDPVKIVEEVDAYREGLVRQRINEAIRATYLSHALGADLSARAADYLTPRAAGESDDALRARAQKSWENLSIGGSYGGYAYQALSVAPADFSDVAVWGYEASDSSLYGAKALTDIVKGEVRVALLSAAQSGRVATSLIERVQKTLSARDRRKVNDLINVVQATLCPYTVDATLVLKPGSVPDPILSSAKTRVLAYAESVKAIGVAATTGGLLAALMAADPGLIVDARLHDPQAPVGGGPCEAAILSGLHIDWVYA